MIDIVLVIMKKIRFYILFLIVDGNTPHDIDIHLGKTPCSKLLDENMLLEEIFLRNQELLFSLS